MSARCLYGELSLLTTHDRRQQLFTYPVGTCHLQRTEWLFLPRRGDVEHVQDVHLFTLVHSGWATSVSGQDIDLYEMKHRIWSALQGLSFIGMIEPALYTNL